MDAASRPRHRPRSHQEPDRGPARPRRLVPAQTSGHRRYRRRLLSRLHLACSPRAGRNDRSRRVGDVEGQDRTETPRQPRGVGRRLCRLLSLVRLPERDDPLFLQLHLAHGVSRLRRKRRHLLGHRPGGTPRRARAWRRAMDRPSPRAETRRPQAPRWNPCLLPAGRHRRATGGPDDRTAPGVTRQAEAPHPRRTTKIVVRSLSE